MFGENSSIVEVENYLLNIQGPLIENEINGEFRYNRKFFKVYWKFAIRRPVQIKSMGQCALFHYYDFCNFKNKINKTFNVI